jgi:RNA polymerase sigma factor (sigma-70 family)
MPWFRKAASDAAVVLRVRAGRRDEFAALVDRYLPVAHAVCYAQLRNVTDAEDAAQDAFIKAYESLDGLREPAKFGPWLLSIVRNVCRNHQRSRAREAERIDAIAVLGQAPVTKPEEQELRLLVRRQVEGLDDIHREALLLHYYGGRSIKEIAALLELSPDAVKKRLQRAREALSAQMLQHLEPAVAPPGTHRDRVKTIMGLLAGVTAAWEAGAASTTGVAAGAGAAGVAGTLASGAIAKIIAGVAAAIAVTGAVLYWPDAPEPSADEAALETVTAQRAERTSAAAPEHTDPTDPTDRSDPSDVSQNAPAIPQSGYFIRGRTVDQSGNPVVNAAITLDPYDPDAGKHHETKSSDDGWYHFPDLNQTTYMLQATAPGLFGADDMSSHTAEDHDVHEIAMLPAGALDGVVQSKDGTPVPDAMVIPVAANWTGEEEFISDRWQELRRVRTDADGRFHLASIWLGSWKLQVDSPTYALYESDYLPVDTSPITLKLTPGAHVEGRVVYAGTDTPVPDLKVNMYRERSTITDSDGRFVLDGVQPGGGLGIEHDSLISLSKGFMVPEGGNVTGVIVEVVQGGIITGRVYDAQTGDGIRMAGVRLRTSGVVDVFSDTAEEENGVYRFTKLQPGSYYVNSVRGPGYPHIENPAHDPLVVDFGKIITGIDFGLTRGASIRGVVSAPSDVDAANLVIRVRYMDHASKAFRGVAWEIRNLETREFTIPGLALGEPITLQAKTGAWASDTAGPFMLGPEGIDGVTLTLLQQPVGTVSGKVVYGGGIPLSGAEVWITSASQERRATTRTRSDGTFALENLMPDEYQLEVHAATIHNAEPIAPFSLGPGQANTDLTIDLGGGTGVIAGRIVDDTGTPVAHAEVFAHGSYSKVPPAKSDENGAFVLQGLELESYGLDIQAEGFPYYLKLDEIVTGTKDLRVVLDRPGSVEGRVIDGRTGQPMAQFEVAVVERTDPEGLINQDIPYRRFVNESGAFRMDHIRPGMRAVLARAPKCFPTSTIVEVIPGQTESGVDLLLRTGATVHVTVVNAAGQPLPDTRIYAGQLPYHFDQPRMSRVTANTDPDGTCKLENLVSGTNQIYAFHPGFAPGVFAVSVEAGATLHAAFALEEGGIVEGVVTVDGRPVSDAGITIHYTEAAFPDHDRIRPLTITNDDGSYRLDELIAGTAYLTVDSPGANIRRSVSIGNNQTTRLDINLDAATAIVSGTVNRPLRIGTNSPLMAGLTVETRDGIVEYHQPVDEAGRFEFPDVAAGQGTLVVVTQVSNGHRVGKTAMFAVAPGAGITREFNFDQGASVRGTVTADPSIGDLYVALLAGHVDAADVNNATYASFVEMRTAGMQRMSGSGPFQFDAVDPAEYTLLLATEGLGQVTATPVTVSEGESLVNVDIAFP